MLLFSFCKRKGHSKHDIFANTVTSESIDLEDKDFGNEGKKPPLPVKHKSQSSINSTEISQ